jgi:hypothetical protein
MQQGPAATAAAAAAARIRNASLLDFECIQHQSMQQESAATDRDRTQQSGTAQFA